MREPIKVVAIIAANPALSSILGMMLAANPALRVRQFDSQIGLETYMRLAPVDLVVADFECESAPADRLCYALRHNDELVSRDFQFIALTHTVTEATKSAAVRSGISEVIVKPMSPSYLLDRVLSRLKRAEKHVATESLYRGPERRGRFDLSGVAPRRPASWTDNVVPLFGNRQPAPVNVPR